MKKKSDFNPSEIYETFIYKSRYARWLEDLQRRENWEESVDRYDKFMRTILPKNISKKHKKEFQKAIDMIKRKEVMPSMRALWTSGKALEQSHIGAYNCAYTVVDKMKSFPIVMYILMHGTGVGYSVERQYVDKMPSISGSIEECEDIIIFEDSRIGWAKGYYKYIQYLVDGQIPKYDMSKIRPAGSKLKTFGGRASGSEVLKELLEYTKEKFINASGRKLKPIECHDLMCKIAEVVISGGTRRSALISLSDLHDNEIRVSKHGQFWHYYPERACANNSSAYEEKPDFFTFMDEFKNIIKSNSGERGIVNREALRKTKPNRRKDFNFGVNPCVTGDTKILTKEYGYIPIVEIIGEEVSIWNGYEWSDVKPFTTGENNLYRITFNNGVDIRCTDYHKFILSNGSRVEAKNLKEGMTLKKFNMPFLEKDGIHEDIKFYSQGFYSGDGNKNSLSSFIYESKYMCESRLIGIFGEEHESTKRKTWKHGTMLDKDYVPVNEYYKNCLSWLSGLLDADGCITRNLNSIALQINSIDLEFLKNIRLMLNRLGCDPKISKGRNNGYRGLLNGRVEYSKYYCQTNYRLMINAIDTYNLIDMGLKTNRLKLEYMKPNRDVRRFIMVEKVENMNYSEETFCVTEPKNNSVTFNGIVTSNCGEIALRDTGEFCNLTEIIARKDDDYDILYEKVKSATILGILQSMLTNFKFIGKSWQKNCEEERLIGVSMTGIMDNKYLSKCCEETSELLRRLRNDVINIAKEWSEILDVNMPSATTTVKPSGNVSQLCNTSSGIHARYSKYYIRRVRLAKHDPIAKFLVNKGVNWNPENGQTKDNYTTMVFDFPIKSPENAVIEKDLTAIQQLEHWKMFKENWAEHNVSVTIKVDENEWFEVMDWVWNNWDVVAGVSFLPKDNHTYDLAPYEEITEDEYNNLVNNFPRINFDEFDEFEKDDNTTGSREFACVGGKCEI